MNRQIVKFYSLLKYQMFNLTCDSIYPKIYGHTILTMLAILCTLILHGGDNIAILP